MQNGRLIIMLRALNKTEWRSFQKYLVSPFFNQRKDVITLAIYLQKELAKPAGEQDIRKTQVWKKTCPHAPYEEKQLRYIMSYLLTMAENFLALQEWQSDQSAHKMFIFNALRKRGLEKNAEPHLIAAQTAQSSTSRFDPVMNRAMQRNFREMKSRQTDLVAGSLPESIENFTTTMLIEILREGCAFLDTQHASPSSLTFPWLQTALAFCEQEQLTETSPTLAMLYQNFRMLEKMPSGEGAEHFFQLKKILAAETGIPTALQRETWLRAINFAIRQQNLGNKNFGREAFALYQSGIENGLIFENGQISKKAYSNTLILALLVGEGAWAEAFLKDYQGYLPEQERENTYRHSLATLFFKQKQFEKVLETLQNVSFTDSLHNLDDRRLLLCSYFELGEWAALHSLLDSFGIWLRRAKNLGYHRELYANLVKFTRRLLDTGPRSPAGKEKLKLEIMATKNVAAKEWLLEKAMHPSPA